MRLFHALLLTMTFASHSYASDLVSKPPVLPEDCSEFLQMFNGKNDRPNKEYSLSIERGLDFLYKDQRIPTYYLRADGIPKGKKFQIANRNAMGKVTVVYEGVHLGEGKLLSKNGKTFDCEPILCGGYQRGEPSQFLLLDPDNKTTNSAYYLPYSVVPATMDELRVRMHYIAHNPETYLFDMENLTPGEIVILTSRNGSESMHSTFLASESGKATSLMSWVSKEAPSGEGSFEVRRAVGTLVIKFPWIKEQSNLPTPLVIFTIGHSPNAKEIQFAKQSYFMPEFSSDETK